MNREKGGQSQKPNFHSYTKTSIARWLRLCKLTPLLVLLTGCDQLIDQTYYLWQLAGGLLSIVAKQQSLQSVLDDPEVDEETKAKLQLVVELRDYANTELELPVGNNYSTYVDLGREAALWNIFATPELSMEAKRWCQPILGCVEYRGYFKEQDALNYEEKLEAQGYDTSVVGVNAFSTLGMIADPIFNTFIKYSDMNLAGLIFHELSHKVLFAPGDSTFNDCFAMTVEIEALSRWSESRGDTEEYNRYLLFRDFKEEYSAIMLIYRDRLNELYNGTLSDIEKRTQKSVILDEFLADYQDFKDRWAEQGINARTITSVNNAFFARIATYHSLIPKLQEILNVLDKDLPAFYDVCILLEALDFEERNSLLVQSAADIITTLGYQTSSAGITAEQGTTRAKHSEIILTQTSAKQVPLHSCSPDLYQTGP